MLLIFLMGSVEDHACNNDTAELYGGNLYFQIFKV